MATISVPVPVLEIGGTHVTAALVDPDAARVEVARRFPLRDSADPQEILDQLVTAAVNVAGLGHGTWTVAIPGPFDYQEGIARFRGVGKFDSLYGVAVGEQLRCRLAAGTVSFLNDAAAYGIGEWACGAGNRADRLLCLTLGTGVGSSFLDHGTVVVNGPLVPPEGRVDLLNVDGKPLESLVSRRALRGAYAQATGDDADVREIAQRARDGELAAQAVLDRSMRTLGEALAPWIKGFGAERIVVGGTITRSWDMIEAPLIAGLGDLPVTAVPAQLGDDAPLLGAALCKPGSWPPGAIPESGRAHMTHQ